MVTSRPQNSALVKKSLAAGTISALLLAGGAGAAIAVDNTAPSSAVAAENGWEALDLVQASTADFKYYMGTGVAGFAKGRSYPDGLKDFAGGQPLTFTNVSSGLTVNYDPANSYLEYQISSDAPVGPQTIEFTNAEGKTGFMAIQIYAPDSTPAPVETTPASVETTPAPVETTPAPVETTPSTPLADYISFSYSQFDQLAPGKTVTIEPDFYFSSRIEQALPKDTIFKLTNPEVFDFPFSVDETTGVISYTPTEAQKDRAYETVITATYPDGSVDTFEGKLTIGFPAETPAPEPSETATAETTETATAEPSETATAAPSETATAEPSETAAPAPVVPTETATAEPTQTAAPEETSAPAETTSAPVETAAPAPIAEETKAPETADIVEPVYESGLLNVTFGETLTASPVFVDASGNTVAMPAGTSFAFAKEYNYGFPLSIDPSTGVVSWQFLAENLGKSFPVSIVVTYADGSQDVFEGQVFAGEDVNGDGVIDEKDYSEITVVEEGANVTVSAENGTITVSGNENNAANTTTQSADATSNDVLANTGAAGIATLTGLGVLAVAGGALILRRKQA